MGTTQNVMTPEIISNEDNRSSAEIQADIRETRGRMDATLDELGNRLTARSLLNSALDWWDSPGKHGKNEAARTAVKAVARQIKHHPMPSLLIGSGIAWLISESMDHDEGPKAVRHGNGETHRNDDGRGYRSPIIGSASSHEEPGLMDKAKEGASHVVEAAAGAVDAAKDGIQHGAERVQQGAQGVYDRSRNAASKLRHDLSDGYHRSEERFEHAVEEYPLAIGVAFAALGALAGLAIPRTRREDDLLGEQSDHLFEAAKEMGNEWLETGKKVGSRVLESVKEEAAEQGLTGESVGDALSQLAEKGGKVFEKAREEVKHAAEDEALMPTSTEKSV
jgi:gas vesicle protein